MSTEPPDSQECITYAGAYAQLDKLPVKGEPEELDTEVASISECAAKRDTWRPDLTNCPSAFDESGNFLPKVGDRILIQYPDLWRDTVCWKIDAIDPENTLTPKGYVRLWDPLNYRAGTTSYIDGPRLGLLMKLPDESRVWISGLDAPAKRTRKGKR